MLDIAKIEKTHNFIRKYFRYPNKQLSSPIGGRIRYNRDNFPTMFAGMGFNVGAEIGVRRGGYSSKLCRANKNLKLYCIDPWMEVYRYPQEKQDIIYEEALKNLSPYNTIIIRKTSMDALNDIPDRHLDFVYIDGDHTFDFICMDIIHWSKKVKTGGIVACHDYHPAPGNGVREAVDSYTHAHSIFPWYVTKEAQPSAFWVNP